ncbi:MAG TPA: SpoIID/LytB domain-containing protein [Pyrinomonadaceae bacterium]|nr:SpoIID/LytB domain-containing protein [Pyrinomonadaceae bacterium]
MQEQRSIGDAVAREWNNPARALFLFGCTVVLIAIVSAVAFKSPARLRFLSASNDPGAGDLDQRLQVAATLALGDRRGAVIVMDPQTGRIRAVVNPEVAFAQIFPPGSAIKPFTALAGLRSGVIDEDSRTLCREKYSHHAFQTTCSHPRDLPPLTPTEALAYSCNYYFSTVGERLSEEAFTGTLKEFGFGNKTGVNAEHEETGELRRNVWRPQNAIGEGNYFQATPLQMIDAYSALVNGGQLWVPSLAQADNFAASSRATIAVKDSDRELILKGMRGAVRYGSAEKANLYSLPLYVFGKTGTATEINGFRTHGWFVGFASQTDTDPDPQQVKLAVLVFLVRGHGFEAAEVSRSIFNEFARHSSEPAPAETHANDTTAALPSNDSGVAVSHAAQGFPDVVRVHLVRENSTHTIAFEDYVRGVMAAEGSMETEPEALKALAIAVRTYAFKNLGRHKKDGYDFCTSTHCERFRPVDAEASYVSPAVLKAVAATTGEILVDERNEPAESYFSASCGGATANLATLWGGNAPAYLRGVRDEYCTSEAHHTWTDVISQAQLARALQSDPRTNVGEHIANLNILRTDATGRAELIAIEGNRRLTVSGWDFKIIVGRALGWSILKSSRFSITHSGSNFVFHGSGFGHGLGLCQEGAHVMAERGATYRQIIGKYFPSAHVGRLNGGSNFADDLMWNRNSVDYRNLRIPVATANGWQRARAARTTLRSEHFHASYITTTSQRETEALLRLLESSRTSLLARVGAAGINVDLPLLEIYINETTGDFVGRTGQPAWAAAATKGTRIELQPLATLKRRGILETTLRHELVHTLIDAVGRGRAARWLAEGLALNLAGEGALVARYEPRPNLTTAEIEKRLANDNVNQSANDMRVAYAAAYGEVKRLLAREGEANVWRRVARGG